MTKNIYRYIDNKTIELELTQGQVCLIDASDYDLVKMHRWYYSKLKHHNTGYVLTNIPIDGKQKTLLIHRLILNYPEKDIDHINMNGTDNRRSNLRICTTSQNKMNIIKQKNNTSGYKGVSYNKRDNKYQAKIKFNKQIHIGYFEDPIRAAKAYDAKALELFGEFAQLNFPESTNTKI